MLSAAIYVFLYLFCSVTIEAEPEEKLNKDIINKHPAWTLIPTDVCGTTRYQTNTPRIVKGKNAKIGQFPWIARLGFQSWFEEPTFNCAGTLITKNYVLTAGHCGTSHTLVRLGEHDTTSETDCDENNVCSTYQDIEIEKYIFNDFEKATFRNDICLILLKKPAEFNEFVKPACLPRSAILNLDFTNKHAQVAGWGYINSTLATVATVLQYISLPIIEPSKCNAIYTHDIGDSQFCAGYPKGKDSCNGDSGGPMTKSIRVDGVSRHYLIGIVSFGKTDCGEGPAVYTQVSKHMLRILENITT